MENKQNDLQLIVQQFDINSNESLMTINNEENFLIELRRLLSAKVLELLKSNHSKLFSILYRIDVNEIAVRKALNESSLIEAAFKITDLIINRQLQKIASKQKNKSNPGQAE